MTSAADKAAASAKREYFDALSVVAEYSTDDEDDGVDRLGLPPSFAVLTAVRDAGQPPPVADYPAAEPDPAPSPTPNIEVHATPVLVRNSALQLPLPGTDAIQNGQDVVNGTPSHTFQSKLWRGKVATPLTSGVSFIGETPSAAAPVPAEHPVTIQQSRPRSPVRTVSAPLPRLPSLLRASSSSLSFSSSATAKKRKRKEVVLKMAPEERQVFKGLNFFYIPPDNINPARKLRITKALEHGATWVKEWNRGKGFSHVIVDSNLTYADILKWLKLEKLPSELILVNEQWPMDSIKYRFLVNPNQKIYEVKGHDKALQREAEGSAVQEPDTSQESVQSLRIKKKLSKPGRWDYVPPKETPERSEGSSAPRITASQQSALYESRDVEGALKLAKAERGFAGPLKPKPTNGAKRTPSPTPVSGGRRELNSVLQAAKALAGPSIQSSKSSDALEEAMAEARRLDGLPLDDSDDEGSNNSVSCRINRPNRSRQYQDDFSASKRQKLNQSSFSCMTGGSLSTPESGPNARTISILQEMADYYTRMNDTWRPIAYRKAINTLKRQTNKITTSAEAVRLPNVGQRLADKIEEIVLTDRLQRLETTKSDPADETLRLFLGVYGVGIKQASQWLALGYRTLEDLRRHVNLSENQRLGIEHYDDFATRIPRQEVEAMAEIVQGEARKIDKDVECIVGGSYRRGAETCGDIDFLVTKRGTRQTSDLARFLAELVRRLRTMGVLVAALSVGHTEDSPKWHGACVLPASHGGNEPGIWRRIDFHLAPESELGAALIYFTGNDIFNRSMRLLAKKKGTRLNQRGLFRNVMRGGGPSGQGKTTEGELVEGRSERRIFEILGVPWREPTERVC